MPISSGSAEDWFSDFWFNDYFVREESLSETLLVMFIAQILTLASGAASMFTKRSIVKLVPVFLSLTVTGLMIHTSIHFEEVNLGISTYQLGYWLTYPSMLLFLIAFILSLLSHKKKTDLQASKN